MSIGKTSLFLNKPRKQLMNNCFLLALGFVTLLGAVGHGQGRGTARDLAQAEAKWMALRPAQYEFTLEVFCFCGPDIRRPVTFRVALGHAAPRGQLNQTARQFFEKYKTVDRLFSFLHAMWEQNPAKVAVKYDRKLGYPKSMAIDYNAQTKDDEFYLKVIHFKPR